MKLTDLPDQYQAQAQLQLGVVARPPPPSDEATEKELQARCEALLIAAGYMRRTPSNIQHCHGGKWFIHLSPTGTQGNPILMDLLILNNNTGRYIEIELKTKDGRLSPEQRCMQLRQECAVCRSFCEFEKVFRAWDVANVARVAAVYRRKKTSGGGYENTAEKIYTGVGTV